jgi:hypothetical protein
VKYLLACPGCGSKIAVQAGQAGQRVQCTCGQTPEVPSVRHLRELEQVDDEGPVHAVWTSRQGMLFLGVAVLVVAAGIAGAIVAFRPAVPEGEALTLKIDHEAIKKEVNALTPAQAFVRLDTVVNLIPGLSEQLSQDNIPPHLLACISLLQGFEGSGPEPLAPKYADQLAKAAAKRSSEVIAQQDSRRSMNDWLWMAGIVGIVGLLLIFLALVSPQRRAPQRVAAGSKR